MILATLAAIAVALFRMAMFRSGTHIEGMDMMLVHCLAIATVVFFTDKRLLDRDVSAGMAEFLRGGFTSAALYALLTGIFIWFHFNMIETEHFPDRWNEMVAAGVAEGKSEDEIRPQIEQFFSPFNYASLTFFGLLLIGAINAVLIAALHHKLLRKVRQ